MKTLSATGITVILTALSFPPFDLGPAAFIALVPLLTVTGKGSGARDLLLGWATGWAASTAVVWWVVNTITHYGGIPWCLAVPILLLMTWIRTVRINPPALRRVPHSNNTSSMFFSFFIPRLRSEDTTSSFHRTDPEKLLRHQCF